jgi:hypothetical protein
MYKLISSRTKPLCADPPVPRCALELHRRGGEQGIGLRLVFSTSFFMEHSGRIRLARDEIHSFLENEQDTNVMAPSISILFAREVGCIAWALALHMRQSQSKIESKRIHDIGHSTLGFDFH